jgi:hypothetical protein
LVHCWAIFAESTFKWWYFNGTLNKEQQQHLRQVLRLVVIYWKWYWFAVFKFFRRRVLDTIQHSVNWCNIHMEWKVYKYVILNPVLGNILVEQQQYWNFIKWQHCYQYSFFFRVLSFSTIKRNKFGMKYKVSSILSYDEHSLYKSVIIDASDITFTMVMQLFNKTQAKQHSLNVQTFLW